MIQKLSASFGRVEKVGQDVNDRFFHGPETAGIQDRRGRMLLDIFPRTTVFVKLCHLQTQCITSIIRGITANLVPGQKNFSSAPGLRPGLLRKPSCPGLLSCYFFALIRQHLALFEE